MWTNPQETADLVTFTEEILNGKLYYLCSKLNLKIANCFNTLLIKNACLELVLRAEEHIKLISHFEIVKHYVKQWMFYDLPPT